MATGGDKRVESLLERLEGYGRRLRRGWLWLHRREHVNGGAHDEGPSWVSHVFLY